MTGEPDGVRVTDEQLIAAVREGDTDSFGILVARWQQPLFRFVQRLLHRPEDARDVCQETFLRILRKSHRFKSDARFSTWMYQIALNLCRDQQRKRHRWSLLLADNADLPERSSAPVVPGSDADPAGALELGQRRAAVLAALRKIPAEQREVLILKEFEGLKFREIAEILGCPESTVKSRMYYGLDAVRSALERQGFTGP